MSAIGRRWSAGAMALLLLGCHRHASTRQLLQLGDGDYLHGNYDRAVPEYRAALRRGAPEALVARQLGLIFQAQGLLGQARVLLQRATELAPHDGLAQGALAATFVQLGDLRDGRLAAKTALKEDPRSESAMLALTDSAISRPEVAENRRILAELRAAHGDCGLYHLAEGMLSLTQRNPTAAEDQFQTAIRLDPQLSPAYVQLAGIYARQGKDAQAAAAFRRAASLAPWRSAIRLREIDSLLALGKADEARGKLVEIARHAPDYVPALDYLVNLSLAERRYADAENWAALTLARDPQNYEAVLAQGSAKLARGDAAAALPLLQKAAALYPRSAQVMYELGLAYLGDGDDVHGEQSLLQAQALSPSLAPPVLALAQMQLRSGKAQAAILTLSELLRRNPRLAQARLLLAKAYADEGRPEQALGMYAVLGRVFARDADIPYQRALLFERLGRADEAQAALAAALRIDPAYFPAADALLSAKLRAGKLAEAQAFARDFVARAPLSAEGWFLEARVDIDRQDAAAAETHLHKAIALDPKLPGPYLELARLDLSLRRPDQALKELSAMAAGAPSPVAYMELALVHSARGDTSAAEQDYRKVLAIDPQFAPALNNLACLYADDLHRPDLALAYAEKARAARPESGDSADTLGWILFQRGERARALELLQQAASVEPENPQVEYHLGMVHYELGQQDSARTELTQAAGGAISPAMADQARRRLALLALSPLTVSASDRPLLEEEVRSDEKDGLALSLLAALDARENRFAEAAGHLAASVVQLPEDATLRLRLARLYFGPLQDAPRAADMAKSAHSLSPDDPEISEFLGRVLLATGDDRWGTDLLGPRLASELLRQQVAGQDSAKAEFYLALCDQQLGKTREAKVEFTRSLALHLAGTDADEARRRLEALRRVKM